MTKELSICLDEDKHYYPGDTIKGYVQLNLNKPTSKQHISLKLEGVVEAQGETIVLINEIQKIDLPKDSDKNTTIRTDKFQFKFPNNKSLPSTANIPKVGKVSYYLTATLKRSMMSSNLVVTKEVKFFDLINIDSDDYKRGINMNKDLGFTNGSKPTQWNIKASKSAFVRGEKIELECEFSNFPPIKKSKGMSISFIRCVHRIHPSTKIIEKKVLLHKSIDLEFSALTSTQSVSIMFNIPNDTPVSVFPISGRIMSVSYIIQADLNMKGAKSVIKLKDHYSLEAAIVVGTTTPQVGPVSPVISSLSRQSSTSTHNSFQATASSANLSSFSSGTNGYKGMSTISLPVKQRMPVKSFHAALGDVDVKPLARLDENCGTSYTRRSYLTRSATPNSPPLGSYFDQRPTSSPPPTSPVIMKYQPHSPPPIDRSLTPLPPVSKTSGYNTISYMNRSHRGGSIMLQQTLPKPDLITVSSPHEIGPHDIINRGQSPDSKTIDERCTDNEKIHYENFDNEKSERCTSPSLTRVPSLTRQSTVSTSSSAGLIGLIDEQIHHFNYINISSPQPPNK